MELSFLKATLGTEADSPVTFELALRRAELIFYVPPLEPLRVLQGSVAREPPGNVEESHTKEATVAKKAATKLRGSLTKLGGGGELQASAGSEERHRLQLKRQLGRIAWRQSKTWEDEYRWQFEPAIGDTLLGRVWDGTENALLKVKDRTSPATRIFPVCRLELRCLREDMKVSGVKLKGGRLSRLIPWSPNKTAAAMGYIKTALASRGLRVDDFSSPYDEAILADILIDDEVT